ncbi:MAG: ArsR/SmtB family transcription factor [Actinomycetales bacterium]
MPEQQPLGEGPDRDEVVLRDPRQIRALAHPARLAALDVLAAGEAVTATAMAEVAGISASAMSYHLRALERFGLVRRGESADGRERPWLMTGRSMRVESDSPLASAAAEAALAEATLDRDRAVFREFLAREARESPEWREATTIATGSSWMTVEEAREVQQRFDELLAPFRGRCDGPRPDGARRVRTTFVLVPAEPEVGE